MLKLGRSVFGYSLRQYLYVSTASLLLVFSDRQADVMIFVIKLGILWGTGCMDRETRLCDSHCLLEGEIKNLMNMRIILTSERNKERCSDRLSAFHSQS